MKAKFIVPLLAAGLIVCGLSAASFVQPDTEFSANENRYLQQAPTLTAKTLLSGGYTADAEDYLSDQIVLRDFWMGAGSVLQRLCGARDINDVYIGRDGYYFAKVTQDDFDTENYTDNLTYIAQLFEANADKNCRILLSPSPGTVLADKLPACAGLYDSDACYDALVSMMPQGTVIDARQALSQTEDPYYHTAHHWTTMGAYAAYTVWCEENGFDVCEYELRQVSDSFRGTMYSKVLLPGSVYDDIYIAPDITIESMDCDGTVYDSLYDESKLQQKDQYEIFMGGNWSKVVIDTGTDTGRSLLVIKDSFANSFLPFVTEYYDTITVLDLRYCRENVSELAAGCTDILVLYELSNFASDTNIFRAAIT